MLVLITLAISLAINRAADATIVGPPSWQVLWESPSMDRRTCLICSHPGHRPDDVVADLAVAWVTAGVNAPLPGYACVVAKRHVVEPYELREHERAAFWEACMIAATGLAKIFQPVKMNYEIHGNTIPHLHMHLYPRYAGDPYEGRSIDNRTRFTRTAWDIDQITQAVKAVASMSEGEARCSFCGKRREETRKLVAGPQWHLHLRPMRNARLRGSRRGHRAARIVSGTQPALCCR
jgi:diadenosine tetraphosphate (Ap4A) HIT family hydrolase